MTTARPCIKTSGTVSVNKDSFRLGFFLGIVSVHCIFSGGKGVVSVFGEGYV